MLEYITKSLKLASCALVVGANGCAQYALLNFLRKALSNTVCIELY